MGINLTKQMSETLIKVEGLYKKFSKSLRLSMYYGTVDAFRSMVGLPVKDEEIRKSEFWALQDINFELKRGETLGLIGQNGCGKTTLLRLINGIFPPDRGKITINGRIGALIAVGAGFHPHMSGRENVFINGTILGMSKNEIKRKLDSIVDFAEIGEFIDAPVATYSSGMTVRLGFAIAIHSEPDILLLDEILAVGDSSFQGKCFNKIYELQNRGVGILLVSHNDQIIYDNCNQAMVLNYGNLIYKGNVSDVMLKYEELMNNKTLKKQDINSNLTQNENESLIKWTVHLENIDNKSIDSIQTRDSFFIIAEINSDIDMTKLRWAISLMSRENIRILYLESNYNIPFFSIKKGYNKLRVLVKNLNIAPGLYSFNTGLMNISNEIPIYLTQPMIFKVNGNKKNNAIFDVDTEWYV